MLEERLDIRVAPPETPEDHGRGDATAEPEHGLTKALTDLADGGVIIEAGLFKGGEGVGRQDLGRRHVATEAEHGLPEALAHLADGRVVVEPGLLKGGEGGGGQHLGPLV